MATLGTRTVRGHRRLGAPGLPPQKGSLTMPNTLAHFGIQAVATRRLLKEPHTKWVFLGCVIPDIPWILQRAGGAFLPGVDTYDLRLYAIAQSSLIGSLLLCGAVAAVSERPRKVLTILSLNVLFHLLIDMVQTKWANGVHLFAPLSWELLNFGLFWPESLPTYILTAFGLVYVAWIWRRIIAEPALLSAISLRRGLLAVVLLSGYFFFPLALQSGPDTYDNHFVRTLRERDARVGRLVEFDRNHYLKRPGGDILRTFAGEELRVVGEHLDHSAQVSVRARFIDAKTIEISELHEHSAWFRDGASYIGLLMLGTIWSIALFRRHGT